MTNAGQHRTPGPLCSATPCVTHARRARATSAIGFQPCDGPSHSSIVRTAYSDFSLLFGLLYVCLSFANKVLQEINLHEHIVRDEILPSTMRLCYRNMLPHASATYEPLTGLHNTHALATHEHNAHSRDAAGTLQPTRIQVCPKKLACRPPLHRPQLYPFETPASVSDHADAPQAPELLAQLQHHRRALGRGMCTVKAQICKAGVPHGAQQRRAQHDLAVAKVQLAQRWEARQVSQRAHVQWAHAHMAAIKALRVSPSLSSVSLDRAVMPAGSSANWFQLAFRHSRATSCVKASGKCGRMNALISSCSRDELSEPMAAGILTSPGEKSMSSTFPMP